MMEPSDPALAEFCESQWGRLVGLLSLYTADVHVAEDLAQETLARVCRDWHHVRSLDAPERWTTRVALNLANSHFRRIGVRRRLASRAEPSSYDDGTVDTASVVAVRQAVAALPVRERTALLLRHFAGLSVRETAATMRCPEGTVKRLTSNAMALLRRSGLADEEKRVTDA